MLYRICKRLIERGQTAGLAEKIDVFYALGRITEAEYKELTELLAEKTGNKSEEGAYGSQAIQPCQGRR